MPECIYARPRPGANGPDRKRTSIEVGYNVKGRGFYWVARLTFTTRPIPDKISDRRRHRDYWPEPNHNLPGASKTRRALDDDGYFESTPPSYGHNVK